MRVGIRTLRHHAIRIRLRISYGFFTNSPLVCARSETRVSDEIVRPLAELLVLDALAGSDRAARIRSRGRVSLPRRGCACPASLNIRHDVSLPVYVGDRFEVLDDGITVAGLFSKFP
jgi:hypothetical protein